jgi:phage/plasmid-like protein (TIGR03299 family)
MTQIETVLGQDEKLTNLHLDFLNKHNMAWTAIPEKLVSETGKPTNRIGLFRSDTGDHIGTHTKSYSICQNHELASMLVYASSGIHDLDIDSTKGGMFQHGKKVYFQIPLPSTEIGNAKVDRYLTAINSHDGTTAVCFGSTQIVVRCQNTFFSASRSGGMHKIHHGAQMKNKLAAITMQMKHTIDEDLNNVEIFRKMEQTKLTDAAVKKLTQHIFKVDDLGTVDSTRRKNMIEKFNTALGIELADCGINYWGLFNAATRYSNHMVKQFYSEDNKFANVVIGTGAKINNVAYDFCLENLN